MKSSKHNMTLFVALSLLASAMSYFSYPLLGRILPSQEYVNITVALSLLTQITTFMSAVLAINIGLAKQPHRNNSLPDKINSSISFVFLCLAVVFLLLSPVIMPLAQTPVFYAVPIGLMMVVAVPLAVISGRLNGLQKLIQLGLVATISASLQFGMAAATALMTHNGVITLTVMAISQIAAVALIYGTINRTYLPTASSLIPSRSFDRDVRVILRYAIVASVAVMTINILQVVDLIYVKATYPQQAHLYADIYIVSRILFFAGMIFVWPLLGKTSLDRSASNVRGFFAFLGTITAIAIAMTAGIYFFGEWGFRLLFGNGYSAKDILLPSIASIVFKLALLVITAVGLYFISLRSWKIIAVVALPCVLVVFSLFLANGASMERAVVLLAAGALVSAALCMAIVARHNLRRVNSV